MRLPPELVHAASAADMADLRFDLHPVQLGLRGSPLHVAVASMMLVKVRRNCDLIAHVVASFPTPEDLAQGADELEHWLRPLGLHRQRARLMANLGRRWWTPTWGDLRDLPGVGPYVADAVQLFCFGHTTLDSEDGVLRAYAERYEGPSMGEALGVWTVNREAFDDPRDAYAHLVSLRSPTHVR